jgi:hypothetical protein
MGADALAGPGSAHLSAQRSGRDTLARLPRCWCQETCEYQAKEERA